MTLPSKVTVFKGSESGSVVKQIVAGRKTLLPDEVAIRLTHSGVCGTDLHYLHNDMVLGHEGIGIVESIGTGVTKFALGDRVGFGYVHGGCGKCEFCKAENYYYCANAPRNFGAQDLDQGSFSDFAVWPEMNLQKIPDGLSSAEAAPLMCAGMTVFTPMLKFGVKPGHRVGIIGIGGLGHLAIGFASKMGAEVAVFSSSESKRKEAMDLGASEFWVTKDLLEKKPEKRLDYLFVTANGHPDWAKFLPLMKTFGQIIMLGLTPDDLVIPFFPFILNELSIHGSITSTPDEVKATLEFAAANNVKPVIEEFAMDEEGVSAAISKLASGNIRYRAVLKV